MDQMTEIRLNGARMSDREAAHEYIKNKLQLPDYYGRNLDALWDLLSTDLSPQKITIIRPEMIIQNLGTYGEALLDTFREAAEENEFLNVEIELNTNEKGDKMAKNDNGVDNCLKGE